MKTIAKILAVIAAAACMAVVGIGCGPKGYVDKSNAVELGAFDRPDYAREMEEQHDREGREHIEIPDGAETITIDGEEYMPISDLREVHDKTKNYIMKCDIDISKASNIGYWESPFRGKFHGNNYKIKGDSNTAVFGKIVDATISNVIISSEFSHAGYTINVDYSAGILVDRAERSVIKDCVNYASPRLYFASDIGFNGSSQIGGFIYEAFDGTLVENCVNYADMTSFSGLIGRVYNEFTVRNCKNYGNISSIGACGGIIEECIDGYIDIFIQGSPRYYTKGVIENCENHGIIIGNYLVGGILSFVRNYADIADTQNNFANRYDGMFSISDNLQNVSISVNGCGNYGDIYRNTKKFRMHACGGISGAGGDIKDCFNSGTIYGLEKLPPEHEYRYVGGIAGTACSVIDCESTTEMRISPKVSCYDKICGYIIKR